MKRQAIAECAIFYAIRTNLSESKFLTAFILATRKTIRKSYRLKINVSVR
jgi:hypothetical protein